MVSYYISVSFLLRRVHVVYFVCPIIRTLALSWKMSTFPRTDKGELIQGSTDPWSVSHQSICCSTSIRNTEQTVKAEENRRTNDLRRRSPEIARSQPPSRPFDFPALVVAVIGDNLGDWPWSR